MTSGKADASVCCWCAFPKGITAKLSIFRSTKYLNAASGVVWFCLLFFLSFTFLFLSVSFFFCQMKALFTFFFWADHLKYVPRVTLLMVCSVVSLSRDIWYTWFLLLNFSRIHFRMIQYFLVSPFCPSWLPIVYLIVMLSPFLICFSFAVTLSYCVGICSGSIEASPIYSVNQLMKIV